jgi:hypothetical protein
VLSAGVSHSYHPREEETFRTRQEHSIIQQNPASSGTPYSPLRSRAGSEEEPAAKRPRLLDPSGLGEESTLGKRSLLITEDFTPSNKSQNRGSSSSSSSIAIQNVTHDQDTTSDMASKVEAAQRTHFRLGENGWEQRDPEATEWQLADPEKLQYKPTGEVRTSKGLDVVFQKYNRANPGDAIDKKKSAYQEELTDLNQSDPSSKRAILLSKLLPLCEQARDYQYKIVGHLLKEKEKREEKKGEVSNKVTSLAVTTLENVIQLNDAPNAVERLITQIEKDDKARFQSQELSAEIQQKIAAEIEADNDPSDELLEVQELINNSVAGYNELIDARIASAKSLKPPYEKEGTQESEHVGTETSGTSEEKKNLYLCEFRARKDYYSAQSILHEEREAVDDNDDSDDDSDENEYNHWEDAVNACNNAINFITNPNIKGIEKVATAYFQAVHCYEEAATAQASGKDKEALYLNNAGEAYYNLAEEQAKDSPSQAVVESYSQAVDYFKKAATARTSGKVKEAMYLNSAGRASKNLAEEQAKDSPSQAVLESYTKAADYYKNAATAQADGKEKEAGYWRVAGEACYNLAAEQTKDNPSQAAMKSITQAVDYFKNAAIAQASGKDTEADYWDNAGRAYYNLAEEQAKDSPSQAAMKSITQAANYHEKAAQATASGKDKEALYLKYTGNAYYNLGGEQDEYNPKLAVVESLTQAVDYYKNAATAQAGGKENEADYWVNAGWASKNLAKEQAKDNPNPAVVESYTQAVNYFKKAATAQADGKEKEAMYLNNAGATYYNLAAEQTKDNPSQAVLESYTHAVNYYENAATAEASGKDKEALYLNNAGKAYRNLAWDNPNPAVVEGYTQAVNYFKKAATAQADGKEKEAMYLNSAGNASRDLNKENNKGKPNKETVRSLEHAIFCYQHAASAEAENKSEEAIKWGKLGDESMK